MDGAGAVSGVHHEKLCATLKTIKEYVLSPSEDTLQRLLRDLNYLDSSGDPTMFDMSTMSGAQLQMDLYELVTRVENTSPLLWKVISILQKGCTHNNGMSHKTLSYRYIPLLGRLLTESFTHEKKLRLLSLLQTFTYGISIQWQEPYLKPMLESLCACITSADAKEASLALSTVVNLLHRNPPAAHAFLRCVPPKEFLKQLINNRDTKSLEFRLEVCKFMILMTDLTESYPDKKELKKFIGMTFQTIIDCVHKGNLSMVQHSVNFFADVSQIDKLKPDLLAYPSYESDVSSILALLEDDQQKRGYEAILLRFLNNLVSLEIPKLSTLMGRIGRVSAKVVSSGEVTACESALTLLVSLAQRSVQQNTPEWETVNQALHDILPVLVHMLKEAVPGKESITLLELLCELTNVPTMKKAILAGVEANMLRSLFEPIVREWHQLQGAVPIEDATFCVEALRLISKFASQDAAWLQLFSLLVQQRGVQMALATALRSASPLVKIHVLNFPSMVGFSAQSVAALSQCLNEVETSVGAAVNCPSSNAQTSMLPLSEAPPLFGISEKHRLDNILSRLAKLTESGDLKDHLALSDLMLVFEYREAEDAREERILNSSLKEANNRIVHLLQRVDTSKEENVRLRRCLLNSLQSLEQTKVERDRAVASESKSMADAKKAFRENEEVKHQFELRVRELEKKNQKLQKQIEEKNSEIQKQSTLIKTQKMENESLEETNKANLRLLAEKDEEIKEKDSQIRQLEIIKNAIYEISSGSKKVEK